MACGIAGCQKAFSDPSTRTLHWQKCMVYRPAPDGRRQWSTATPHQHHILKLRHRHGMLWTSWMFKSWMFNPAAGRPTNQQNTHILLVSRVPTWPLGLLLSLIFRTPNKNFRTVVQCHLFSRGITIQILNTYSDRIKLAPPSFLGCIIVPRSMLLLCFYPRVDNARFKLFAACPPISTGQIFSSMTLYT